MANQKRNAIKSLKLDKIAADVARTQKWTPKQKQDALRGYRAYLSMRLQAGPGRRRFLAIDRKSDEIWHAHITNTVQYRKDCTRIFGRFLDHTPLPHPTLTAREKSQYQQDLQAYAVECKAWGRGRFEAEGIPICC